jgi:protein-S-isoprenylcysteine O-methyltransferase Ste14
MKPYFAAHTIQTLIFACTILAWFIFEARQALKRRSEASSADRGSLLILRIWIFVAVLAANLAAGFPAASLPDGDVWFGIGIVLMWCGIGLRLWSFMTLGRYFTFTVMTSSDQPVITTGPYNFLRHPSYLGILLVLTGIGATYANWLSLAALAVLPPLGFVYRIRVEEKALSSTLGSAYTSYASARKRLIPFVW